MARRFRLKIREGRSFGTFVSSPDESPQSAAAGEEVVVSEQVAAFLLRKRAADLVEVVESADVDPTSE
jgi:hypothetical protein